MAESCAAWCWRWRIPASWPLIRYRLKTRMRCGCIWMRSIKTGFILVSAIVVIHTSDSLEKVQYCCTGVFFFFPPLATFPPYVTFCACYICANLSGSDPRFLLCAFVMLNNKQRWNNQGLFLLCVHRYLKNSCLYHTCVVSFDSSTYFGCFKGRNFSSHWVNGQYKGNP